MFDKILSGWGKAKEETNTIVFDCDDMDVAQAIADSFDKLREEMGIGEDGCCRVCGEFSTRNSDNLCPDCNRVKSDLILQKEVDEQYREV